MIATIEVSAENVHQEVSIPQIEEVVIEETLQIGMTEEEIVEDILQVDAVQEGFLEVIQEDLAEAEARHVLEAVEAVVQEVVQNSTKRKLHMKNMCELHSLNLLLKRKLVNCTKI
jgi:hypothetical protein